jgi:cyclopropane fatty-acyl-phospholipid synthase-like methyltransferase
MEQQACLTTKDVVNFCNQMQECKDGIANLEKSIEEIKKILADQTKKFDEFKSFARDDNAAMNAQWGDRFEKQNDENEKRFSNLENWRALLTGAMLIIAAVGGFFAQSVWALIAK